MDKNIQKIFKKCYRPAVIVLTVTGLIILTIAYFGMRSNVFLGSFNQPVLTWMVAHRQPQITNLMLFFTTIADPMNFLILICLVAGIWAIYKKEMWRPIVILIAMGVATSLSTFIKILTASARPSINTMIAPYELDYSFPSGHVLGIAVFLLVIGYLIYSRRGSVHNLIIWIIGSPIIISIVAVSRLYLGYHWLTDTIASFGLSLIILSITILADRLVIRYYPHLE